MFKKIVPAFLSIALLLNLVACVGEAETKETKMVTSTVAEMTVVSETQERTVKDVWGREVKLPAKIERIICLGSGAPRLAAYLGVMDMIVGGETIDQKGYTVIRDYNPIYFEQLKSLPTVGKGGGSGDNNGFAEEIIKVKPDVIFASFSQEAADELQNQTQIPVVSVRYTSTGLANETFYQALHVFGEAINRKDRAEEVLAYVDACKSELDQLTKDVPAEAKKKAYTGAVTFNGKHGFFGTYAKFGPFQLIHANNVADEIDEKGFFEANAEQVLVWDPDVIFLDPGSAELIQTDVTTNPSYFAALRAVAEGNVYTMPSFNHAGTNITYGLIASYFAGSVLYPEQFKGVNFEEKAAEILTKMLGKNTFSQMAEGGLYYGKFEILK